jgi:putative inorganic carbon (hco3(-)) transporter
MSDSDLHAGTSLPMMPPVAPVSLPAIAESRLTGYSRILLGFSAACLPLYAVRWQYGPLPTTLLENVILATIVLYLVAAWHEGRLRFHRSPFDLPILLLLISGLLSILVAKDHRAALGLYKAYFIEPIALFYVATDLLRRPGDYRTVLTGFGIGTSSFAVLNIGTFTFAFVSHTIQLGSPASAIYTSANEVAMFLEPPLAFATALVLFSDGRRDRQAGLAWVLLLLPALLLTLSRGAFLALAALALFATMSLSPRLRKPLFTMAGLGAAAVVAAVLLGSQTPLVIHRLSAKALEYTFVTRFEIYVSTLKMVIPHSILGLGLGGYLLVYNGFPEIYPHDLWLAFWVELGLLGLFAFALVFVGLLRAGWRALSVSQGFQHALVWGAVGTLILWGVHGVFDTPYWKNDMSVEFWLVAAIQVSVIRTLNERQADPKATLTPAG